MAAQRSSGSKSKAAPAKKGGSKPIHKAAAKVVAKKSPVKGKASKPVKATAKSVVKQQASKPMMRGEGAGKKVGQAGLSSNGVKPAKKESPRLSKSDMEHFRGLLLEKRREILGDVGSMEMEAYKSGSNLSNMPIHMADVGTDNFEQEFTLGLIESERMILREIQEALLRIENGTYAVCIATGKPIAKVRLEAVPWAKYTMEHARALEQGLLRRDASQDDDETESGDDEEE